MTDSSSDRLGIDATSLALADLRSIKAWLAAPQSENPIKDLEPLLDYLSRFHSLGLPAQQRFDLLTQLQQRTSAVADQTLPTFEDITLPIPRKTRQIVRKLQDILQNLADHLLSQLDDPEVTERLTLAETGILLWQALRALSQHVLISCLTASSAGAGLWLKLHETFRKAVHLGVSQFIPSSTTSSLQDVYYGAILLGCAQPASFSSQEIRFIADYLERFASQIEPLGPEQASRATFWIDPLRDAPAQAKTRRPLPQEPATAVFSCARLAALIDNQLAALTAGGSPEQLSLPPLAATPTGIGVLHRLKSHWGDPLKRRFPRRRQNYRVVLCAGLDDLWHLFHDHEQRSIETSGWMITNESPDGYAVMHVMGKMNDALVGDVVAIRSETGRHWQVCIIRWALSENQEHLELGLQILSTKAIPATLTQIDNAGANKRNTVLILPSIPPLRPHEVLIVASGFLDRQPNKLILMIERDNVEIREVRPVNSDGNELNSRIELVSIEPDPS